MYQPSPSPENRDPDLNKELTSIDNTQKHVSDDSTPVSASYCIENPVSMDTAQNKSLDDSSPPSNKIPASQVSTKDSSLPVINQDSESHATMQTIEKDLKVSLSTQNPSISLPSQANDQEPTMLIATDSESNTPSSGQQAQNDTVMLGSRHADDTKDINMTDIILPDKVNEEDAPAHVAESGRRKLRWASDIKTREPRKRKSATNVNYREQTETIEENPVEEKSVGKKPAAKKPAVKKPAVTKKSVAAPKKPAATKNPTAVKTPAAKKTAEENPAEEKLAEEKLIEEKPAGKKRAVKRPAEKELVEEEPAQIKGKKPKRQKKLVEKSEVIRESSSDVVKVRGRGKNKRQDEDEEAGEMPKKKVTRTRRTKEAIRIEKEEKREKEEKEKEDEKEDEKEKEDEEAKLNRLLRSRTSFLTEIDMRELIPQWLEALPEEDKLELASLLPNPDCEINEAGKRIFREGFGANSSHLYDAAVQWQNVLALGGFEEDDREPEAQVLTDSFKDENYERNWGERVSKDQKTKSKARGRPKKNK